MRLPLASILTRASEVGDPQNAFEVEIEITHGQLEDVCAQRWPATSAGNGAGCTHMPRLDDDFFRPSASRAELTRLDNFNAIRLSCAERIAAPAMCSRMPSENFRWPILRKPSVTMAHLRRRPGMAGSRWPERLERIGGALQVRTASGQAPATICKNACEDSDQ